jgi:sugar diacid utilization regulator
MIYVEDLTRLAIFKRKNIELVSGKSGLSRYVSWPHVLVTENTKEWLIGGDVIIVAGLGINCSPEVLNSLIEQAVEKNSACMIVLKHNVYIKDIEPQTRAYSDRAGFPIFVSPWEIIISHLTREISTLCLDDQFKGQRMSAIINDLLSSLLNLNQRDIAKKIEDYGLTGKKRAVSVCLHMKLSSGKELEYHENASNLNVFSQLLSLFKEQFDSPLFMRKNNRLVFLIDGSYSNDMVLQKCRHIHSQFKNISDNLNVKIGVGQVAADTGQYSKSYQESELVLKLDSNNPVRDINDLGIFRFLVETGNTEQIKTYAREVLAPLSGYDERHNLNLVHSLQVLCGCDMNINQSAKKLLVHKNTLLKRILRIEEILGVSLKDVDTKHHFYNLFKVLDIF